MLPATGSREQSRLAITCGSVDSGSSHSGACATLRILIVAVIHSLKRRHSIGSCVSTSHSSSLLYDSSMVSMSAALLMCAPFGIGEFWKRMPTYCAPPTSGSLPISRSDEPW